VPKVERKYKKISVEKIWKCPVCDNEIKTVFNGQSVQFYHRGKLISRCGGRYEKIRVECPGCKSEISFTKKELEEVNER